MEDHGVSIMTFTKKNIFHLLDTTKQDKRVFFFSDSSQKLIFIFDITFVVLEWNEIVCNVRTPSKKSFCSRYDKRTEKGHT